MNCIRLIIFLVAFCTQNGPAQNITDYKKQQKAALKSIHEDPTNAYEQLIRLLKNGQDMPDTVVDYSYKLMGIYHWNVNELDSAEFYFKKAMERNGQNIGRRVGNLLNLATVYGQGGKLTESQDLLFEALSIYQGSSDRTGIGKCYIDVANVYSSSNAHDLAITYILKAIELYESDTLEHEKDIGLAYFNLANSYTGLGDYKFAVDGYDKALPILRTEFPPFVYAIGLLGKSYALSKSGSGQDALELARQSLSIINETAGYGHLLGYAQMHEALALSQVGIKDRATELFQLAFENVLQVEEDVLLVTTEYLKFLNATGDFYKAEQLINSYENEGLPESNLGDRLRYQEAKLQTVKALGNARLQLDVLQRIVVLKDSLSSRYDLFLTKELHERYKADILQKDRELQEARIVLLEKDNAANRLWILISLLGLLTAIVIGFYLWYTKGLKERVSRLELDRIQNEKRNLEKESAMKEENLQLREKVIDQQKQELLATAMEVNSIRENIRKLLADHKEESDVSKLKTAINSLVRDQAFTERLLDKFKSIDPNFINELSKKFPELTKSELEFCSLMKLGLHNKEIAHILQISHESVIKKRYRLAQKLRASEGLEVDEVLRNIARP